MSAERGDVFSPFSPSSVKSPAGNKNARKTRAMSQEKKMNKKMVTGQIRTRILQEYNLIQSLCESKIKKIKKNNLSLILNEISIVYVLTTASYELYCYPLFIRHTYAHNKTKQKVRARLAKN